MLSWLCIFHLAVCTTQGIKALSENKVTGLAHRRSLVSPCLSFFLSYSLFQADPQPLSLLYFLICNILSLSLSKSLHRHSLSWGYPWILWGLDPSKLHPNRDPKGFYFSCLDARQTDSPCHSPPDIQFPHCFDHKRRKTLPCPCLHRPPEKSNRL